MKKTISTLDKCSIWYRRQLWLRGITKTVPHLGGIDYYLDARGKKAVNINNAPTAMPTNEIKSVVNQINGSHEIRDCLKIVAGPGTEKPRFVPCGRLKLTDTEKVRAAEILGGLSENYTDDPCAVVIQQPSWQDKPLTIRYHELSYGGVLALRELGRYIGIISANVLLISDQAECMLVHRRSADQYDYPNTLHTFGGAFIPPGFGSSRNHSGIRRTAIREILEESDIGIDIHETTPIIVIDEHKIQYVQTSYIGVNIRPKQVEDAVANWEGNPVVIRFSDLQNEMSNFFSWTPAGWVDVLIWLALNTPGAEEPIRFGELSGPELAQLLMTKCLTPYEG